MLRKSIRALLCVMLVGASTADCQTGLPAPKQQAGPRPDSLTTSWTPVGPNAVITARYGALSGRVTALAFDPNDKSGNTVYLGSNGGGVWKSTNAASPSGSPSPAAFVPLTDTLPAFAASAGGAVPSLAIGAIAVQPLANGVVLAGTGDPNNATDSLYGEGILRSPDGGATWTLATGSSDGLNGNHSFAGLAAAGLSWSTSTPQLAVAAMTSSPLATIEAATKSTSVPGLYYSTDAGMTWHMSTIMDGSQIVQQPLSGVQVGNPATAVVWDAARGSFFAAIQFHGYYASTDGATWTRLAVQPGTGFTTANCPVNALSAANTACPLLRGSLAVQSSTGDLYALSVAVNNADQGLWQDLCAMTSTGACATKAPSWSTRVDGGALEAGGGSTAISQGAYNLALAAVTTGSGTLLFAGTQDVYRCELTAASPGACTWRNTTNAVNTCATPAAVAPAQHTLTTLPLASGGPIVMIGNDGGLWRSLDGIAETSTACALSDATHFDTLNPAIASGGSLAEVVGLAQSPTDASTLLIGLGVNGTAATSTSSPVWPQVASTEGGFPLIDPSNSANWFATTAAGVNLKLCTKGSACTGNDFTGAATIGIAQVGGDNALLHPPLLLDPSTPAASGVNLLVGTCRVWRGPATDGSQWTAANALSPAFDGSATPCTAASALLRSLAAGGPAANSINTQSSGSTVLYAGMAGTLDGGGTKIGGHIFVTRSANTASANTAWTDITSSSVTNINGGTFNPGRYDISAVALDQHDATGATVYAAIKGFGGDIAVPHLYRSIDFGAHWATVSANLPAAPANAVVVDPNDANTVYVATDAGVYVTQAINTCATQSCWSQLGTGLPNAPVIGLSAGVNLPTGDGRTGMLRAATYGRGVWQIPLLTAVGIAQPAITLSTTALIFTAQQVSTQSASQTVNVTSSGNAQVVFGTPAIAGDFTETDTCAGLTLQVGATCSVSVVFGPTATGTRTGQLTIYANVKGGQASVSLTGTGTAPASIVLTPSSLTFAAATVNQTSAAQIVSIANTGGVGASITSIASSGDFAIAQNTCGSTLAAQTACAVSITFTPTAGGTRTGTLTVVDSAGTQTASLTGIGQSPPTDTLSPTSLIFTQQQIGSASPAQQVTLTNAGDQTLTLVSTAISGEFIAVNGCGASVAAHTTCAVSVQFAPAATGTRTGTLTVNDSFRTQVVPLTGIGVAPPGVTLTPTTLSFAATGVGLASPPQTVALTNNGGLALMISNTAISSGFALAANSCGNTVAAGAACTMQIIFAPATAGSAQGTLVLMDNAPSGQQTVNLVGAGIDFTLAPSGSTIATVASGTTATFPMLLSSGTGLSGNVASSCTGAPAHSICTVSPSVASLGGTVSITVTVQTGVAQVRLDDPVNPSWLRDEGIFFACTLPFLMRRRFRRVLSGAALAVLFLAAGCSAGRIIPSNGSGAVATPSPAGTYTLTVSATAAGVTHTVPLMLIVQ